MRQKRKIHTRRKPTFDAQQEILLQLERRVFYTGSPHHKRLPGDYNLVPPAAPRLTKSLCDSLGDVTMLKRATAQALLMEGVKRGLISPEFQGDFPKRVWAVTAGGFVVEAKLEDHIRGTYHGYPLDMADPIVPFVLTTWKARKQQDGIQN